MAPEPGLGVVLQGPASQLADTARRFEDLGAESVWTGDYFQSGLVRAAVIGTATTRARIGTHVLQAFARSPLATALAARELQTLTGGRFVLGLGSQVPAANLRWHGIEIDRPVAALGEYVAAVRALLDARGTGEAGAVEFNGQRFRYRVPAFGWVGPSAPKVWIGGAGPAMVGLAAGTADGLAGHLLWTYEHIRDQVVPIAGTIPVTVARFVAADTIAGHRLDLLRRIAHYAITPAYQTLLCSQGLPIDRSAVLAALRQGDDPALERELGPHLHHWCITSAHQLRAHRAAAAEAGVSELVLLVPFDPDDPRRVHAYEMELARLVASLQRR